jgi:hypothetical protein
VGSCSCVAIHAVQERVFVVRVGIRMNAAIHEWGSRAGTGAVEGPDSGVGGYLVAILGCCGTTLVR